jgi:branched-chain amino acid transport system substrate-binding protein
LPVAAFTESVGVVRRIVGGTAVGLLLLAGCGTRLPDSAFPSSSASPAAPSASAVAPSGTASAGGTDVGVTADTITVGNISSLTNMFDPHAFSGPFSGAKAYFDYLNAHGGVNGRQVRFVSCDDQGSGDRNITCVQKLRDEVFAFASNAILSYAGAQMVNDAGIPDVGAQPVDTAYTKYPHLWDIYGESYPRDGKSVGYHGVLTGGTEVYRYFATRFPNVPRKAGVIYYNQADSQKFGQSIVTGLRVEGYQVTAKQLNFVLPDYDGAVVAMKRAGVQFVFDAIDRLGSVRLCQAMEQGGLRVTAKVTTTQGWVASVKSDYRSSPHCRNEIWATGNTLNYDDTAAPQVATFRQQMRAEGMDNADTMSEWAIEGWAGAMWLADAMKSCGADLTRHCVEQYMARPIDYTAGGLLQPRRFTHQTRPDTTAHNCLNVVRWQDSANDGKGGWVNEVEDMTTNCFDVHVITYSP